MTPALRPALSLDGWWDFAFDGPTVNLARRRIRSPAVWQTQFPELRNAAGTGRYRRAVSLPGDWRGRAIRLVMEGVFHETVVLIDEQPVARHGDGWTTLVADLTQALAGRASFVLGVDARLPDDLGETLAGKQDWYGLQGGVWKPARIEALNPLHIARLAVRTSVNERGGVAHARGVLSQTPRGTMLGLTLRRNGGVVAATRASLDAAPFEAELVVDGAALWSPDAPNLYELEVALLTDDAPVDAIIRTIGFRQFEARAGRLHLNGEPFQMFGALDQDWHAGEECRPATPQVLEQRFRNARAMGLNTLRCHVKIPDKLYFELADRLGLVVWLDMPYCEFLTARSREALARVFHGAVAEHASHASICIWTLCNEGWGVELDDNPDDRRWLLAFFDEAKAAVPGSLVVDNSPCFPRNYHVKTDIEDFHWYNAFPHQNAAFAATAEAFANRAAWAWSPHGDAEPRGDEPLVCSEFGVWGLPHRSDILDDDGGEPWWFESGHDWNLGAAYPHGAATRFRDAGLAPVFGDLDGFADAAQEHQFRALKAQIEMLRWERALSGYVITELNDVQWEANGLMDARNNPRRFADRLAGLQTPWLVIARAPRTAIVAGETIEIEARLAGPVEPPAGASVEWRFGEASGRFPAGAAPARVRVGAPTVERIRICDLTLEARDSEGKPMSENRLEFCVVPPPGLDLPRLFALDEDAKQILRALRWPMVSDAPSAAETVLTTRLTTSARELVLAGAHVLLVANADDALADPFRRLPASDRHNFPKMEIARRLGTPWQGQWMGAFCWRRTDGAWARLPGGPMLDEHWTGLLPEYVLKGFLPSAFSGLVDAGVVVAWLHHAAAFSKRTLLGKGRLTATTFALSSKAAADNPLSPHLLAALASS